MMKNVITGSWICSITLASCYAAVTWSAGRPVVEEQKYFDGIQYKKLQPLNVPIIADGALQGYVVAEFVFTADARTLHEISVPVDSFLRDEAFRYIYSDNTLDFRRPSRYDVNAMIRSVRENVNQRMGAEIVKEILIENFNFVDRADIHF